MPKDIEIEIKVQIENSEKLLSFLEEEASFQYKNHQVDEYFSPEYNDFLKNRPVKEWLRLRDADGVYSITYKHWYYDDDGKAANHCDEYETKIENFKATEKLLKALNFKKITTVDKVRKAWNYRDYEIVFDSVKNLGDFIELEYIGKDEKVDPKKIAKEMIQFLKNKSESRVKRDYRGYPFLLLFPDERTQEFV